MTLPSFSKITGCTYPVLNSVPHEMLQMVAQSVELLYKVLGILLEGDNIDKKEMLL
jgi:hypothetical protein